jgi:type IV pilus assembly protein PilE
MQSKTSHSGYRTVARGFTLIEVMITVVIIAILAAIALPAYSDYVKRGRLTDAVGKLADMRVKMEQLFQDKRSYAAGCTDGTVAPKPADTTYFAFTCPTLSATQYQIVATGQATMAGFAYTLDQDGTRRTTGLPTGWSGASATSTCWVLNKTGGC